MVVHPPAVAAQALRHMLGRHLEGAVGVRPLALAAHEQVAAGLEVDVAGEERALLPLRIAPEGDVRLQRMVEVLARDGGQALPDMRLQRLPGLDLLPGNGDVHRGSPSFPDEGEGPPGGARGDAACRAPSACPPAAEDWVAGRQDQAGTAFSRLRCTDDGMRSASRYLAT